MSNSGTEFKETPFSKWIAPDVGVVVSPGREMVSEESIARVRKAAREEGYTEGYSAGVGEGKALTQSRLKLLDKLILQLSEPLTKLEPDVLQTMVKLSMRVSQSIIGREVSIDEKLVLTAVSSALETVPPGSPPSRIKVHPLDMDLVSTTYADMELVPNVSFEADPALVRGGAVVEAGSVLIDAQVEARIDEMLQALLNPAEVVDD